MGDRAAFIEEMKRKYAKTAPAAAPVEAPIQQAPMTDRQKFIEEMKAKYAPAPQEPAMFPGAEAAISTGLEKTGIKDVAETVGEVVKDSPRTAKVLKMIGGAISYPAGIARSLAAQTPPVRVAKAIGKGDYKSLLNPFSEAKELLLALKNQAKSGAEHLKEAGVPKGPNLMFGITPRGVAGGAIDIATDPFLEGTAIKQGGKGLFKSAFKEADRLAVKVGAKPVSETLFKHKIIGTKQQVLDKSEALLEKLRNERDLLLQQIDAKGIEGSMKRAVEPAKKELSAWSKSKSSPRKKAAETMLPELEAQEALGEQAYRPVSMVKKKVEPIGKRVYTEGRPSLPAFKGFEKTEYRRVAGEAKAPLVGEGKPTLMVKSKIPEKVEMTQRVPDVLRTKAPKYEYKRLPEKQYQPPPSAVELSQTKTDWANQVSKSAWDNIGGKHTPLAQKFKQKVARGFKEEVENMAEKAGVGPQLKQYNEEMGSILNAMGTLDKDAAKAAREKLLSQVDAAIAVASPLILAGKQAGKVTKTSWARTGAGRLVHKFGPATYRTNKLLEILQGEDDDGK